MSLPKFNTLIQELATLQTTWGSQLDPLLARPTNQSNILKSVSLNNGTTVINHLLGRKLQGWKIVRQRSAASVYDSQDSNLMQDKTLVLISSAAAIVDIEVF